ncbi:MAG: transketolase [bacterium]
MRNEFAQALISRHKTEPNLVFLTGDLGYFAFEKLREIYQERFINAGVAEQNMISVAAGLAYEGFVPWVYDIAPFALLRPYEQIRNDVCLHNLPVKIVGNGGGYGYGIMGATHHTLEDIAIMRLLPNMRVYIPLTAEDVETAVNLMAKDPAPNYLRLNLPAKIDNPIEEFQQWRLIKPGNKVVVIGVGPVLENIIKLAGDDIEVWALGILPVQELPSALISSIIKKKKVLTIEEHCGQCGLNELMAKQLLASGCGDISFRSVHAQGYPDGRVGSQKWLQEQSGLAGEKLAETIKELINDRLDS